MSCNATLVKQISKHAKCIPNVTYGCLDERSVWTKRGCHGKFQCGRDGSITSCGWATEWDLQANRWWRERTNGAWRDQPMLGRADDSAPQALLIGAMLNLTSSPYTSLGAVRKVGEKAAAYNRHVIQHAVHRFMSARATRRLIAEGHVSVHVVHDLDARRLGLPEDAHGTSQYQGVWLHRINPSVAAHAGSGGTRGSGSASGSGDGGRIIPAHDARWAAYITALQRIKAMHASPVASAAGALTVDGLEAAPLATPPRLDPASCAFSVDFSDVRLLNVSTASLHSMLDSKQASRTRMLELSIHL